MERLDLEASLLSNARSNRNSSGDRRSAFAYRNGDSQQAQQSPTPQATPGSTPDDRAANLPSPNESPSEKPDNAEAVIVLIDRGSTITVYEGGNISGLDDVSGTTRNEIAQVLLSGRIDRPPILKDLAGEDSALRGSNRGQPFKLIAPGRNVIVSNRPTFKWENVAGATAYTVYVHDSRGQIVARSEELTPDCSEWLLPRSLRRGEVYAWTVTAVVNGNEVVAPGPAAPEMEFQVLSTDNLKKLTQLKRVRSHLALGVFYLNVGVIDSAEQEFQQLARLNPKSQVATKLLRNVRLLRQ